MYYCFTSTHQKPRKYKLYSITLSLDWIKFLFFICFNMTSIQPSLATGATQIAAFPLPFHPNFWHCTAMNTIHEDKFLLKASLEDWG